MSIKLENLKHEKHLLLNIDSHQYFAELYSPIIDEFDSDGNKIYYIHFNYTDPFTNSESAFYPVILCK